MPAVNTADWLTAIDAHPETVDTDLLVATALANGDAEVEGIDPDTVTDSVEELMALGFLESVLAADHPEGEEHLLELFATRSAWWRLRPPPDYPTQSVRNAPGAAIPSRTSASHPGGWVYRDQE